MWMPATTTTPSTGVVVSLSDAKAFLRLDAGFTAEDGEIAGLIVAAASEIERETGLRLLTQTVRLQASEFRDLDHFQVGPIVSISSVSYLDPAGATVTLGPSAYESFGADLEYGLRPAFAARWPSVRRTRDAVRVVAVIGYGAAADIPAPIQLAIKMLVADWYENREDTVAERSVKPETMPNGVSRLLVNFRP